MTDLTEPDFSKMYTREILEWQYKNFPYERPVCDIELVGIEKQELERLRELEAQVLSKASTCRRNPVLDCRTIAQTLLKVSPEHREWLETNFKEYL